MSKRVNCTPRRDSSTPEHSRTGSARALAPHPVIARQRSPYRMTFRTPWGQMTQLTYDSLPTRLRAAVSGFDRVYDEHIADNDELLPHVLLGELVRFLSGEVALHGSESAALGQTML